MNTSIGLEKFCAACGKERKRRSFLYDPQTMKAFCANPYICNDDHPNSPQNLILNQNQAVLVDYDTANEGHKKLLLESFDSAIVDKIKRIMQSPITLRIPDPAMAQFIVESQEELGTGDTSNTIRYFIQIAMENRGIYLKEHKVLAAEKAKTDKVEQAVKELSGPTPATLGVEKDAYTF